ncbi:unnamed protein product [Bursaphelenchus okinawaensis]|uniref:Uncharacterized protein n=1 Tax=Bursaphelenchus okinawaensis TaxID=465554 RepID=A0A811L1L3_9BILA|nr:unnamed protein product [Bursaphelenchus okinawaensis]CAG9114558.1 unnamed protein product [Bursaphelenchus okinawaensis]
MEVDLFRLLSVDQLQKAVDDHEHELLTNFGRFLAAFFSNLPILCPIKNDIEFPSLWKLVLWKESDYDQALYKKLTPEYVSSNIPPTYSASLPVQLFLITNNLTEACLYVDHFNDIRSQILLRVLSDLQYGLRLTEQHVTQVFVSDFIGRLSYGMVNGRGYGSGYGGEYGRGYGKEYGNGYDRPSNQVHDEQNGTNGTKNVFNDYNDSTSSVTYNNINITVHTVMSDDQIKTHVDVYTRLSIMLNISWTYDLLQYLQSALQYVIDGLPETVDDQVQLPRPPVYVLPAQDDENIPELVQTNIMYQLIRVYLTVLQRCNWLKSVAGTLMSNIWKYNLNFSTQVLHTEVDDVDTAVYHSFEDVLRMILIHNYRDQMALLSRRGAKKDDIDKIRQRMSRMGYSRPQDGTEGFENFGTNGGTIGAKMDYKNDDNSVQYDSQSSLLYSHHGHQSNFSDSLQYDNGYSNEKGPLQYKNDYSNDKKKLQYQNSYINDKSSIQYKDDYSNSKSSLQYRKNYSSTNHSKTDYIPQLEADEIDQLIKILQFFDDISTDKERYLPPLSESTVEQWRTAMYSEVNVVSARPTTELNLGDDKLKMIVPQEVYLILDYVANSLPYVSLSDRSLIGISLKLKPSEMVKVENSTFYSTIQRGNRSKMSFGTKGGELASTMNTNQIDTHSNGINHVKYEKNNASDPNIALLSTKEPYGTLQNRIQASLVRLGGRSISHANTTVKSLNYMSDVYHSNVPSTSANIPQFEPQASSYDKDMSNSKHNMGNNENLELVNQDQSNIKHDGSYDGQEKLKHNEDKGNINHEKDHGKSPSHNNQATSFQIQPIPTNQAKSGLEKELLQEKEYIEKIRKSTMLINAQKASLYYDVNEEKRVEILNKIRQLKMTKSPGMRRKVGPNGDGNDVNSAIKLDYSVTQPSNSTMKPGYSTEHLSYSTMQFVQPGDSTAQPGFSTTHPSYSTMQPIHSTMKPNFSTKKPIYGTMQHIHSTTQPNYSTVTPDQDTKHNISRSHHEEPLDLSDELKAISARLSSLKQKWSQSPEDIVKQSLNQNLNFDVNFNVRSQFNDNLKMKSQFDENSKLRPRSGHTSTNKSFTSQRPATYKNIQIHNVNSKLYVKDHEDNEDLSSGISSSSISPRLSDRKKVRKTRRVLETERERMLERQRMEQEAEANSKSNNDGLSNDSDSNTDSGLKSSGEVKNGAQKGTEKKDRLQDATKHDGGRYGKGQTQYSYDNDKNIEKVERKNYSDENNSEIDNDGLIYPNPQHVLYKTVDYVPEAIPSPTTPASIGRLDLSLLSDRQEEKKKKSTGWTEIKVLDRTPKHFVKKKEVVLPDWVKLLPYEAKPTSSRLLSLGGAADSKAKSSRTGRKSKSPYLNIKDVIHDSGYLDFETGRRQKAVEPKLEDTVENQSESEEYDQNNVFDMTEEQINRLINS